ncbi:IS3 family transposase, partial [Xenorhabdus bovienii]|uniref:IS3 family transposase n=1 Tax=Xenorhabdus bovienii TaxID=40576 RepID=UPI0023B29643
LFVPLVGGYSGYAVDRHLSQGRAHWRASTDLPITLKEKRSIWLLNRANAVVERFFGSLKHDWLFKTHHENQAEMKKDVLDYLHYYNLTRLHTANNDLTPVEYEMAFVKVSDFS